MLLYNDYQRKKQQPVYTYRKEKGFAPVCLAVRLCSIMKAALERKKKKKYDSRSDTVLKSVYGSTQ